MGTNSYQYIVTKKINDYFDYKNELENCGKIHIIPNEIFIDGSVNFETIPQYFKIGATTLVCGFSSIMKDLKNSSINKNIERILESLK